MRLGALHRTCAVHPRAVLVVLLAFAIEIVPVPSAVVRHRHAHDDAPHVHAGRIGGTVVCARAPGVRHRDAGGGVHAAPGSRLHPHHAAPVVVGALPEIVPLDPPRLVAPLPALVVPGAFPVSLAPGRARSPPDQAA